MIDRLPGTGLIVVDRELRILLMMGDLYDHQDQEAALGRHVAEVMSAEAWRTLGPRYRSTLDGGTETFDFRGAGAAWTVRMSGIASVRAEDPVAGAMVLIAEATDRVHGEDQLRASARLHRSVVEVLSEGVVVMRTDGTILSANEAARRLTGLELPELGPDAAAQAEPARVRGGWWDALDARHPDGTPFAQRSPGAVMMASGREVRDVPASVRRGDGVRRTLRLNYGLLRDAAHRSDGVVVSFHDVTESDAAHARLVDTETRLRDAHERAGLSSWEWAIEDGRITVLQALPGQLVEADMPVEDLLAPVPTEDRQRIDRCVQRLIDGGADDQLLGYRYDMPGRPVTFVETRMRATRAPDGSLTSVRGTTQDVTARVHGEAELRSARDYLRAVTDSMAEAMCTFDLEDRAIYVNPAAERLLGWPAEELLGLRFHDTVHFRREDGTPYPTEDCPIRRARHANAPVHADDEVFIRSDGSDVPVDYHVAPFETPEGFRGTVLIFSDISERRAREARVRQDLGDVAWVTRINHAIEHHRLVLHAQPIIELRSGETVQHELLIRMLDEDGTTIPPGDFLPAAERFGLIREIDRWVVRQAAQLSAVGYAVELNISAESLGSPDFAAAVEEELLRAGADCSLVVMEITETAVLRDVDAAERFIERIRALGCRFALDDFGTGYGGFTYLKRLSVDFLKIDVEFVRDLVVNAASQHVVRAVVNLARDFGAKTVAEGVEDADAVTLLRELGVDYAQGYHIDRPAPLERSLLDGVVEGGRATSTPRRRTRTR